MTYTLALYAIVAATVLLTTTLAAIAALIARDGGPADGWEAGHIEELDDMLDHEDALTVTDWAVIADQALDGWESDDAQLLHLAGDWREQLTPPDVPQLDPCTARPYIDYMPRHADDTIELHVVPDDWCPPVGARRIALLTDNTEQFEAVQP